MSIHGLGVGFSLGVLNRAVIDGAIAVTDETALAAAQEIARKEDIGADISSSAALVALRSLESTAGRDIGPVVTVFPGGGESYLEGEGGNDAHHR